MNKKVLITGANGQDGAWMIKYLLENTENTIIAATRRTSQPILQNLKEYLDNPRVSFITLDLDDPHSIDNAVFQERPDYFINFGASAFVPDSWNMPDYTIRANTCAVIHILEAIRRHAPFCRFYNACSSEIFGEVLESPQSEKTRPNPRSVYGVSKNAAREVTKVYRQSYGLYAVSGILFNHESELRQSHYVTRKITKNVARIKAEIEAGKDFAPMELGNMSAKRDWSHALDFVDGVWRMLNQDFYRPKHDPKFKSKIWEISDLKDYVMSSDETHSVAEFVARAFEYAMIEGTFVIPKENWSRAEFVLRSEPKNKLVVVNQKFFRPAEVELLCGDSSQIRRELGWSPKFSFLDLVRQMVQNDVKEYSNGK